MFCNNLNLYALSGVSGIVCIMYTTTDLSIVSYFDSTYMYILSLCPDGQPFVVREVSLLEQSLCSVTLDWTAAPVPEDAPVLNYEITLTTQDQERSVYRVVYVYIILL